MKCTRGYYQLLSHVWLFAVPWTVAHQVPLSMGWYRNTGTGCHFFLQGIFPTQGLNPHLMSPTVGRQILYQLSHPGSACMWGNRAKCKCVRKDQKPSLDIFPFCSLDNCWCSVNVSWKQKVPALWGYTEMSLPCYDWSSFLAWAVAIVFLVGFLSPIATFPVPLWPHSAAWTDSVTKSWIPLLLSWKPPWHSPPSLKSDPAYLTLLSKSSLCPLSQPRFVPIFPLPSYYCVPHTQNFLPSPQHALPFNSPFIEITSLLRSSCWFWSKF